MELKILNKDAKETGKIKLPVQFNEQVRVDLVKRAVLVIQANSRQKYGASPEAGKRASAYVSKRRRAYKTTYGIGQSRTPRKVLSRSGTRFNWVGAFAPQTVGGRRAHPPKLTKDWSLKINPTEKRKAIRCALSATMLPDFVRARGHVIPDSYPFIINDEFMAVSKTADLRKALVNLGLDKDLDRAKVTKVRAGKGKVRGRRHKTRKSVLFVVSKEEEMSKAVNNLPGCEIVLVNNLNSLVLAPGAVPGRLTLFTESAIKKLNDEFLFMKAAKKEKAEKKEKPAVKAVVKKPAKKAVKKTVKKTTKTVKKVTKNEKAMKDE